MEPYRRIDPALLAEAQDHQLFQNVWEHLHQLLGADWHPQENIERLPDVPESAKNVWYLWLFAAEVCGSGISGWLVDHAPASPVIIATHAALKAAGAASQLELLEAGIAPARPMDPNFLHEPQVAWFDQFRGNPKWPTFDEIDAAAWDLCAEPLSTIVAKYIRAHSKEW